MELKQCNQQGRRKNISTFNRTAYGIETWKITRNRQHPCTFNRTAYGIETEDRRIAELRKRLLIAPLMELKRFRNVLLCKRITTFNRTAYGIETNWGHFTLTLRNSLLIAPLMELKPNKLIYSLMGYGSFNRTAYGIETQVITHTTCICQHF